MTTAWFCRHPHFRRLRDQLVEEGFDILDVWMGRHLRLRVSKNERAVIITIGCTPAVPEHAVHNTMQQARRGIADVRPPYGAPSSRSSMSPR